MTARAAAIIEVIRSALHTADESLTPADADLVYGAIVAHVRARRPVAVSPLGVLPPPGEVIRDPRS